MATWRFLLLTTYPPDRSGTSGFSRDLVSAVEHAAGTAGSYAARFEIAALLTNQPASAYQDAPQVSRTVDPRATGAMARLAAAVNAGPYDAVCLQHDFQQYPGPAGERVLDFFEACRRPVVTTLHSLPPNPDAATLRVVAAMGAGGHALVVMSRKAEEILRVRYGVPRNKIVLIPHGTPEVRFRHRASLRRELGLDGRRVVMSLCLLQPNRGIEVMIDAMDMVSKQHPDAVYVVAGRTHPDVAAEHGDAYREMLGRRAAGLRRAGPPGGGPVMFVDRFLPTDEALTWLQAADVVACPYLDPDQTTSGALVFALAAGKAVVSTPFLHAEEALGSTRGILVPFRDSCSLAGAVMGLLNNPQMSEQLERAAFEYARRTLWPTVGRHYLELLVEAGLAHRLSLNASQHALIRGGSGEDFPPAMAAQSPTGATLAGGSASQGIAMSLVSLIPPAVGAADDGPSRALMTAAPGGVGAAAPATVEPAAVRRSALHAEDSRVGRAPAEDLSPDSATTHAPVGAPAGSAPSSGSAVQGRGEEAGRDPQLARPPVRRPIPTSGLTPEPASRTGLRRPPVRPRPVSDSSSGVRPGAAQTGPRDAGSVMPPQGDPPHRLPEPDSSSGIYGPAAGNRRGRESRPLSGRRLSDSRSGDSGERDAPELPPDRATDRAPASAPGHLSPGHLSPGLGGEDDGRLGRAARDLPPDV